MKILVSIPDYRGNQMQHLNRVIDEYRSYKKYDVTINIHSTVDISRKDINLIKYDPTKIGRLAYIHRPEFINHRNDYDLFIYSENDILIKEEQVDLYLKYNALLPENYCLGFMRYEQRPIDDSSDKNMYCIDLWPHTGHILQRDVIINDKSYFILRNPFQSFFLLTKKELNYVIDNCQFRRTDWEGIETSSAGVYKNWEHADGVINKVWTRDLEDLKKCLVHHTSNVHVDFPHPYKYLGEYHKTTSTFNSLLKDLGIA